MSTATQRTLELADPSLATALFGPNQEHLRCVERCTGARVGVRGRTITLGGERGAMDRAERVLVELEAVVRAGQTVYLDDIERLATLLAHDPKAKVSKLLCDVVATTARGRRITPKTPNQGRYVEALRQADVVFGIGPAGTGKTYLAMAHAVACLERAEVARIVLCRPAVEAGERLGFLPGDLKEKVNPYLRPLHDALHDFLGPERTAEMMERDMIEVAPLAFMRGRTLNDAYVILDEAQNTRSEQMKMFLTRLGFGARAVITGDVTQIDLPRSVTSGLREARKILDGVEGITFIDFGPDDVVRHPLVQRIVRAYEARSNGKKGRRSVVKSGKGTNPRSGA
ncbi:MAG: PhoH family protein [Deltaproteobacteria bacterium]|nr:PhoH family protein [Deltaproteobacteria bacterium]